MGGIVERTNYANVADGQLDLLWQTHGRHAGPGCYIGAAGDPKGGGFRVQRHTVVDGGVFLGGDRSQVMTGEITGDEGKRVQVGFGLLLAPGFVSSSSSWNGLQDWHYGGGSHQSPIALSVRNSDQLWVKKFPGGAHAADTQVFTFDNNKWYTVASDILWTTGSNGVYDVYVDGSRVHHYTGPTLDPGWGGVYFKQGFYRSESDTGTSTYYFQDTVVWENATPDAMLAYFGGVAPPPPSGSANVKVAVSSIQAGDTLTAGKFEWQVSTDVPAKSVTFFVAAAPPHEVTAGTTVFVHSLDLTATPAGALNIGFTVKNLDGTTGPSFPSFPITVTAVTPPPSGQTNAELRDLAEAAFKATTISYPEWVKRVAAGKYPNVEVTKWWQGFSYLDKIK